MQILFTKNQDWKTDTNKMLLKYVILAIFLAFLRMPSMCFISHIIGEIDNRGLKLERTRKGKYIFF